MTRQYPKREATANAQIKLRVKEWLRADIETSAREKGVSLNSEIISRLIRSFEYDAVLTLGRTLGRDHTK